MTWIKVFSPATIGNIGPGFDVLGLAIKGLGDTIEARKIDKGVIISSIESKGVLSYNPMRNTAGIAAQEVLNLLNVDGGVELKITKGLPSGSGLGSSAASAAGAAYATNQLYGKLSKEELIMPATKAEEVVSGGFFADNTAPALLGGATLTRLHDPLDIAKIGTIDELKIVLITPDIQVLTKEARNVLPKQVPMKDFISNVAHACMVASAFSKNDYSLFSRALSDKVVEPVRSRFIKGFEQVKKAALEAGADGVAISGSGPTLFAITNDEEKAKAIETAMNDAFEQEGVESTSIITKVDQEGTRILE